MATMFAREIDKERAAMAEFVIDTSRFDENVGEKNLLADVLGPDAEYTQFTAAFGRQDIADPLPSTPTGPNPESDAGAGVGEHAGNRRFDMLQTTEKPRYEAVGMMPPASPAPGEPGWMPSAQTMPRGARPSQAMPPVPMGPRPSQAVPQLPILGDTQPNGESGFETVIIQREPVLEKRPGGPIAPPIIDEQFHAEETRVLSRDQVDFLKLIPQKSSPCRRSLCSRRKTVRVPRASDADSRRTQPACGASAALARKSAELAAAVKQAPRHRHHRRQFHREKPVRRRYSFSRSTLDFHDAATEYLDWSPIEPSAIEEMSLDPSSANFGAFRRGQGRTRQLRCRVRPPRRSHRLRVTPPAAALPPRPPASSPAPILLPRSATGAQPPVGLPMPPLSPSAKSPPPPPPAAARLRRRHRARPLGRRCQSVYLCRRSAPR